RSKSEAAAAMRLCTTGVLSAAIAPSVSDAANTSISRRGRILSREQILDIVANRDWTPYDRSIDVLVGKIRRKLSDDARDT
ncbi:helix-turn-helix domain-containing protein, partial [Acinetobacter baumannii]